MKRRNKSASMPRSTLSYRAYKNHLKSYFAAVQLCSHPNHIFVSQQPATVANVVAAISWLCGLAQKATCCQTLVASKLAAAAVVVVVVAAVVYVVFC